VSTTASSFVWIGKDHNVWKDFSCFSRMYDDSECITQSHVVVTGELSQHFEQRSSGCWNGYGLVTLCFPAILTCILCMYQSAANLIHLRILSGSFPPVLCEVRCAYAQQACAHGAGHNPLKHARHSSLMLACIAFGHLCILQGMLSLIQANCSICAISDASKSTRS
jgi:hypothetical protein